MVRKEAMVGRVCCRGIFLSVVLSFLAACSPEPIKTSPPLTIAEQSKPVVAGSGEPIVLSYCYSSQLNWSHQVMAAAREACPGGRLHFQGEDVLWTRCPLLQPVRVTFLCYPPEEQPKQSLLR